MKAIILAAGQGKRMKSNLQKVMHPILGKPIVQYVAEAVQSAGFNNITVVVDKSGEIEKGLARCGGLFFAVQEVPKGTGDAVRCSATPAVGDTPTANSGSASGNTPTANLASDSGGDSAGNTPRPIAPDDEVLVLCGDMPLITSELIRELLEYSRENSADCVVTAVHWPQLGDFGRVYDSSGEFIEIVEARDITPAHGKTEWANTGVFLFKGAALQNGLAKMTNDNAQGEYYITDVPKIIREEGGRVRVFHSRAPLSVFTGINTQAHLAEAAAFMRTRINQRHMEAGVRMLDPDTTYIDDTVKIGRGTVLYPGCILEGACEIAENAVLGPYSHLTDTTVGENAKIRQSVTTQAKIGANTEVGPFAYLRPNAVIGEKCRIGNFVEVKNATLGDDTKVAHLAYIGDADVGKNVNYSCGAITANYDGEKKHRTKIGDNAFIGSNVNLIAPIEIGEDGFVAAGSTLTDDLPPCALGIARGRQCVKLDWAKK